MKIIIFFSFCFFIFFDTNQGMAQTIRQQQITSPAAITEKPDLRVVEKNITPEFKVTVNTWNAGKISASQAVISYSIRIDDTTQPLEHGVCYSTNNGPTIASPKTIAKGYTTNTLYGTLSGLKPETRIYVRAYMKLLNYPDKIYYGNEISFTTLAGTSK